MTDMDYKTKVNKRTKKMYNHTNSKHTTLHIYIPSKFGGFQG